MKAWIGAAVPEAVETGTLPVFTGKSGCQCFGDQQAAQMAGEGEGQA